MNTTWNKASLLELARGFQKSRVILSAVELELFQLLKSGGLSAGEVAEKIGGDLRGTAVLLDALASMELIEKREGRYSLHPEIAPLLTDEAVESSILPMLRHSANMWMTWSDLTTIVRTGSVKDSISVEEKSDEQRKAFIGGMHVAGLMLASSVTERINFEGSHRLLDIGGGSGVYTITILNNNPSMGAVLFDQPSVLPIAESYLAMEGVLPRVELAPGGFLQGCAAHRVRCGMAFRNHPPEQPRRKSGALP